MQNTICSVIQMLRVFMTLAGHQALDVPRMRLMLILHLTFVVLPGVLFAVMDWIRCHAEKPKGD
jgi:hypothetical protein